MSILMAFDAHKYIGPIIWQKFILYYDAIVKCFKEIKKSSFGVYTCTKEFDGVPYQVKRAPPKKKD